MSAIRVVLLEPDGKIRRCLLDTLEQHPELTVVGMAVNVMMAASHAKLRQPDVILMSDAGEHTQSHVDQLIAVSSAPILMLSCKIIPPIRQQGQYNAVHTFKTPATQGITPDNQALQQSICQRLTQIASTSATTSQTTSHTAAPRLSTPKPPATPPRPASPPPTHSHPAPYNVQINPLIALGASTGGTEALSQVLKTLDLPHSAVVIVQHIPAAFGAAFVKKLDRIASMTVVEARNGLTLQQGHVYVGVSDEHFFIERNGNHLICRTQGKEKVSGHCPSVDVLFDSVAKHARSKAVGALLTGMGEDGARGLKKMRDARARTLAQDEKTSVVWGMPGTAVKLDAAEEQAPLSEVARRLMQLAVNGVK